MNEPELQEKALEKLMQKDNDRQVAGSHYQTNRIQPWDIIEEYDLNFFEGNAIKYILRRKGNRLEDLKKAAHYLEKMIEIEEFEKK